MPYQNVNHNDVHQAVTEKTSIPRKIAHLLESGVPELCSYADPENSSSTTPRAYTLSCRDISITANPFQLFELARRPGHLNHTSATSRHRLQITLAHWPCLPVLPAGILRRNALVLLGFLCRMSHPGMIRDQRY